MTWSLHASVEITQVLCSQRSTREARLHMHGCLFKGRYVCFLPRSLGMEVANSLGSHCPICRVTPYRVPQNSDNQDQRWLITQMTSTLPV